MLSAETVQKIFEAMKDHVVYDGQRVSYFISKLSDTQITSLNEEQIKNYLNFLFITL